MRHMHAALVGPHDYMRHACSTRRTTYSIRHMHAALVGPLDYMRHMHAARVGPHDYMRHAFRHSALIVTHNYMCMQHS